MLSTRFTELVGCTTPIQQAGMGAVGTGRGGVERRRLRHVGDGPPSLSPGTLTSCSIGCAT